MLIIFFISNILFIQNKSFSRESVEFFYLLIIFSKISLLQRKVLSQQRRSIIGLRVKKHLRGTQPGTRGDEKDKRNKETLTLNSDCVRSDL